MLKTKSFPSLLDFKNMRFETQHQFDAHWAHHERHFFIFTNSARPVFIRYGDETVVMPLLCTIITFLARYEEWGQVFQTITAGNKLFVFYYPSSIIFVCVSSLKLPVSLLIEELKMLEALVFSLLSPSIMQALQSRYSLDLQRQIGGSDRLFSSLLYTMDNQLTFIYHDYIPMAAISKDKFSFSQILSKHLQLNKNFASAVILFYEFDIFTLVQLPNFTLTSSDLLILSNGLFSLTEDSYNRWTPIWLPKQVGSYHLLTSEVPRLNMKLIIISNDIEAYQECTQLSEDVVSELSIEEVCSTIVGAPEIPNTTLKNWIIAHHQLKQVYSPIQNFSEKTIQMYRLIACTREFIKQNQINGPFLMTTNDYTIFGKTNSILTLMGIAEIGISVSEANQSLKVLEDYYDSHKEIIFDFTQLNT